MAKKAAKDAATLELARPSALNASRSMSGMPARSGPMTRPGAKPPEARARRKVHPIQAAAAPRARRPAVEGEGKSHTAAAAGGAATHATPGHESARVVDSPRARSVTPRM